MVRVGYGSDFEDGSAAAPRKRGHALEEEDTAADRRKRAHRQQVEGPAALRNSCMCGCTAPVSDTGTALLGAFAV